MLRLFPTLQKISIVAALGGLLTFFGAADAQKITYGPFLARGVTPDTMIIRWGTDGMTDPGQVAWRKKGEATFKTVPGTAARDHEVLLPGLALGSQYEYSVASGPAMSATYPFQTCPVAGMPMDIVFYGDSRSGPANHARVAAQVAKHNPEIIFESGDIAPAGQYSQYISEFFPAVMSLLPMTPFMAAPGNHDFLSPFDGNYGAIFPSPRASGQWLPYYAFVCGNAMFIALNSNDVANPDQQNFLIDRLRAAAFDTSLKHVFVWFHHPPYSVGTHGDSAIVQSTWVPLFRNPNNKVTAVFSGHDHLYARMNDSSDVLYLVSGGAGADLYADTKTSAAAKVYSKSSFNFVTLHIAGNIASGVAYDDSDVELDRFSVTKPDVSPPDLGALPADMTVQGSDSGSSSPDMAGSPPPDDGKGCTMSGHAAPQAANAGFFGLVFLALALAGYSRRLRA